MCYTSKWKNNAKFYTRRVLLFLLLLNLNVPFVDITPVVLLYLVVLILVAEKCYSYPTGFSSESGKLLQYMFVLCTFIFHSIKHKFVFYSHLWFTQER